MRLKRRGSLSFLKSYLLFFTAPTQSKKPQIPKCPSLHEENSDSDKKPISGSFPWSAAAECEKICVPKVVD